MTRCPEAGRGIDGASPQAADSHGDGTQQQAAERPVDGSPRPTGTAPARAAGHPADDAPQRTAGHPGDRAQPHAPGRSGTTPQQAADHQDRGKPPRPTGTAPARAAGHPADDAPQRTAGHPGDRAQPHAPGRSGTTPQQAADHQDRGKPPRPTGTAPPRAAGHPGNGTAQRTAGHQGDGTPPRRSYFLAPAASRSNALHAGAWWIWALGLATAASRTTNPLLLGLLVGVAGYVVAARRTDAPWARSYGAFVKLGLFVIGVRVLFSVVLGSPIPGTHVLFSLPEVPLPDWARGVRVGGRVSAEQLLFALYDGAKLATLLVCVGAANALANPARLLKSLPGALYEVGVAVVVAMTFAPNMVADVVRLRTARRLRGRPTGGIRAIVQIGLPVLEGALERSVAVAASMDARGYGRTAHVPPAVRRTTTVLTLGGLLGVCAGSYGLLAAEGASYALPLLAAGLLAALAGLRLGGRRSVRTRYRPDRWGPRSWLVAGSGAAVAVLMIRAGTYDPQALHPGVVPPTAPTLPLWPAASILIGLLPAFIAPVPASQEKP